MMHQDHINLQQAEQHTTSSKDSVNSIIHIDLGKRTICSTFVPCTSTGMQKTTWMEIAGDFTDTCDRDPSFLQNIISGDERWCYWSDPEIKWKLIAWCSVYSAYSKKTHCQVQDQDTVDFLLRQQWYDPQGIPTRGSNCQCCSLHGSFEMVPAMKSCMFSQSCTGLESGVCCTTTCSCTLWSMCTTLWLSSA